MALAITWSVLVAVAMNFNDRGLTMDIQDGEKEK